MIRRDLEALARAGFPIYDEKVNGTSMWKLNARPFRGLEQMGLSTIELCAIYFARTTLLALGAGPLVPDMDRAFVKLESALPEATKKFLDRLPVMIKAKTLAPKKHDARKAREILARITDASLSRRRVEMTYDSRSSRCTKRYGVESLRVTAAEGASISQHGSMNMKKRARSPSNGSRRSASWTNTSTRARSRPSRSPTPSARSRDRPNSS